MGKSQICWYVNVNKIASTKGWVQSHRFSRRAGAGARFFTRDSQHACIRKSLASIAKRVFYVLSDWQDPYPTERFVFF